MVAVGRNAESGEAVKRELGDAVRVVSGDAAEPATSERAVAEAVAAFGGVDGLYHVAGGSGRKFGDGPLHEISDEGWKKTLDLNLTGMFNSNRAVLRHWLSADAGAGVGRGVGGGRSVLNMGSVLGDSPSKWHFATHAYAATKAAAIGMTKAAAAHYAEAGIRFNVIAPALVETPMARRAAGDEAILEFVRTKQPLDGGRIGRPEDLDAAVVFFLSDGSRFCTGQVLYVDGGWRLSDGQLAAGVRE